MSDLRGILRTAISFGAPLGKSLYQESVTGTKGSDLIYPAVRQVYFLWKQMGRNRSSFAQNVGKVSIVSGAILFGLIKGKKVPLILAEVITNEMMFFTNSQIVKRFHPPKGSKWTPEQYRQAVVANAVLNIGFSVLSTYLFSRRNSTLSMKPYYFHAVAFPILKSLRELFLDQFITPKLKEIVGDGKCPDGDTYRYVMAKEVLSTIALQLIVAKCATLATGESIQKNWSVEVITFGMAGITTMYL